MSTFTSAPLPAPSREARERFVALLGRLAPSPGRHQTPFPSLRTFRAPAPTSPDPAVYRPAICFVAQGAKEATLAERVYRYDPLQYLVIGAPMPVRTRVVQASEEAPFLSMILDLATSEVRDLVREVEGGPGGSTARWEGTPPLRSSPMDARLLDAAIRFLEAVSDPVDCRVLGGAIYREIVYLALRRDQGDLLRLAARRDGRSPGVERALHHIHRHLDEPLAVEDLARVAGMSVSSLHHTFKAATSMSPIQYVKRVRLDRARQILVDGGRQAAEVAFLVGYESPSQFSREFKRLFGLPPRRYLETSARS